LNDARTTNVGGSIPRRRAERGDRIQSGNLSPRYVRLGDGGDVAFEAVAEPCRTSTPGLTLADTEALWRGSAETRGAKGKPKLLVDVLTLATPLEAKYLVKLLTGDLRHRIARKDWWKTASRARSHNHSLVRMANMLTGDIGEARRALARVVARRYDAAVPSAEISCWQRPLPT